MSLNSGRWQKLWNCDIDKNNMASYQYIFRLSGDITGVMQGYCKHIKCDNVLNTNIFIYCCKKHGSIFKVTLFKLTIFLLFKFHGLNKTILTLFVVFMFIQSINFIINVVRRRCMPETSENTSHSNANEGRVIKLKLMNWHPLLFSL